MEIVKTGWKREEIGKGWRGVFIGRSRWSGDQGLVRKDMEQFMNIYGKDT